MENSSLFIFQIIVALSCTVVAFRLGRSWLIALIAVQTVIMNIFVLKMMNVFSLEVTGGNVLYASVFLGTDLLCEHYGKKQARQAVWIGFSAAVFFIIMSQFIIWYTPSQLENGAFLHNALATIFETTPRIVLASMGGYLVSQHLDIYIYTHIKKRTGDKYLWLRNNGSTLVSQFIDSIFFTFVGLYGIVANADNVWHIILFTYLIKVLIAFLDTPFMYLSKMWPLRPHYKTEKLNEN